MKKLIAVLLSVALLGMLAVPAAAVGYDPSAVYDVQAESAYIVSTDTNIIIYEKSPDLQVPARGLTKLMTLALLLTHYQDTLDTTTYTQPIAVSDYVYGTNNADVRTGETLTLRQAMYAMLLRNANEVAMGVAYQLSGNDLTGWVSQMNSLSARIGTTGSTWTDACGIDSGNVTTAKDMYLILRYLMGFDAFVEAAGTYQYELPANTHHSSTSLLLSQNVTLSKTSGGKFYRSAAMGGKVDISGYENDNGTQSAVTWSTQNGETYIYSVMSSPDTCDDYGYKIRRPALYETGKLMDWVYDSFAIQAALDPDEPLCEIKVKYSMETDTLKLYPADSMMTILPATADGTVTQKVYNLPDSVAAPVSKGDTVGSVTLMLAGEAIGTVELLAGQDVSRNSILFSTAKLQQFFGSLYFRVVLILSLIAVTAYVIWYLWHSVKTRNSKKIRRH